MKKIFFLLSLLIFFKYSIAQQNHYVILEKNNLNQVYSVVNKFPKDWIKKQWDSGYLIQNVNFKQGEWFIVMNKPSKTYAQKYMMNPSNQQIKDKLRDGYSIQDICLYTNGNKILRFYVFDKISVNTVSNYFFVGSTSFQNTISKKIKSGWDNGWICTNIKSLSYNNRTEFSILMPIKGNDEQLIEYRADFPNDLINNKKINGYKLTSITYDGYKKSWCVIMSRKKRIKKTNNSGNIWLWETPNQNEWTWFNYKSQKNKIDDYINNKGFHIIGLN